MPYSVSIKRQARQKLKSLSTKDRLRITDVIDELALDPDSKILDVKPLGAKNVFRLRVGNWRVIYERFDQLRILAIEKIGPRGDIYK